MELLVLIIAIFIAYQIGVSVTAYKLRHLIFKEAKARGIKVETVLDENTHPMIHTCWVEKINDTFYLYDAQKNEFICQASTIDDLAELALKYKNIKVATVLFEDIKFLFKNGKIVSNT